MKIEPVGYVYSVAGEPIKSAKIASDIPNGTPLYTHPVKELNRMDVYELAIESGFMLSTQYGEAEHKLMPVSDGDTLVKLANAILRKAQEQ